MAELMPDGTLVVQPFTVQDIPAFVLEDLVQDLDLCGDIYDASGLDVLGAADGEEDVVQDFIDDIYLPLFNAKDGDIIMLTKDYYVAEVGCFVYGGSEGNPVVLDLNGHTINASEGLSFYVYGALQIRDSGAGGEMLDLVSIALVDAAYLFLDGGRIEDYVNIGNNSTFTMYGGTIDGDVITSNNTAFTMHGGTLNGQVHTYN